MRHSKRFSLLWLLMAACLSAALAGCDPGPPIWKGVNNPGPVSPQPKEAGK